MDALVQAPSRPLLTHARRRMLAWVVALTVLALAAGAAIYLAHPERRQHPGGSKSAPDQETRTRIAQEAPGVAAVEVQRGRETRTYRFRRVGKQVVVEETTPPRPQKRGWWQRLFGRD